jgi:hypothetical protein
MDVSCCGLTELPEGIGCMFRLMELNVATNDLQVLPESISLLTRLCELNLCDNKLSDLPQSMGLMYGLQVPSPFYFYFINFYLDFLLYILYFFISVRLLIFLRL